MAMLFCVTVFRIVGQKILIYIANFCDMLVDLELELGI